MQRLVLTLGLVLLGAPAPAEDGGWLEKASWTQDYEKALKEAKKTDRLVFAFFSKPG